jgi:hypothetical protein
LQDVLSGQVGSSGEGATSVLGSVTGGLEPLADTLSAPPDASGTLVGLPDVLSGQVGSSMDGAMLAVGSVTEAVTPPGMPSGPDTVLADLLGDARGGVAETLTGTVSPVSDGVSGQIGALAGTAAPAGENAAGPVNHLLADVVSASGGAAQSDPSPVVGSGLAEALEPASGSGDAFGGLPFEALPALTGEQTLLVSAGLAAAVSLALASRLSGPSPGSLTAARFVLASVPPIPVRCMVGGTVSRASVAVAGAASSAGGGVLGAFASAGRPVGAVASKVGALGVDVRDGFRQGAGRAVPGSVEDMGKDTPLWLVAMMLGALYVAVIGACMWVAKNRWNLLR